MTAATLTPRRHAPPPGWPPATFEALTDALAAALVAAVRRAAQEAEAKAAEARRAFRSAPGPVEVPRLVFEALRWLGAWAMGIRRRVSYRGAR